ncbi:MAG: TIGR03936 family radical SAM-associated protein [Phycisphaerae bacterium]
MTSDRTVDHWVIDFTVDGDIRFVSHRDMLRLFGRAVVRAKLPIRYSEGFNPRPKLSLPLPRPVAVASNAERLVLELTGQVSAEHVLTRLGEQMPEGIELVAARQVQPGQGGSPQTVRYRLTLPISDPEAVARRAVVLLDPCPALVKRTNPKTGKTKDLDIRPFMESIEVGHNQIDMVLRVTPNGSARPGEVAIALGLDAHRVNHRVRRLEVQWQ